MFHVGEADRSEAMQVLLSISAENRRHILVIGIEPGRERAALLQAGFGDVVSQEITLDELRARAGRLAASSLWLPRIRQVGALKLDLLAREAFGFGEALNLNPREFALLWRLAESLDQPVTKQDLVRDVWRMGFVPETNSIAVHMSRLRRKLSLVGLRGMIETLPLGGYRLRSPDLGYDVRRANPDPGERTRRHLDTTAFSTSSSRLE
jgi:two-component system OmpR family response regulator